MGDYGWVLRWVDGGAVYGWMNKGRDELRERTGNNRAGERTSQGHWMDGWTDRWIDR